MSHWNAVEPLTSKFFNKILLKNKLVLKRSKSLKLQNEISETRAQLIEQIKHCIVDEKLSFSDTVLRLGVSPTTVRRVCRTLKVGRYSENVQAMLVLKSFQVPYGWISNQGVLEQNIEEWKHMEQMKKFRDEGKSYHWIARFMDRNGVKTKNKGRWFGKTIRNILERNKKYFSN